MGTNDWQPCDRGPCAAEAGHEGTCAEASGFEDWSAMTALPNAAGQPVHREYEKPTEVPCAGCGRPVALTWTKSADGHGVFHSRCYLARMEER